MKATELMVGDWVHRASSAPGRREYDCKVLGVGKDVIISQTEYGYCPIEYERVNAIPLTSEILEKNGFKDAPAKDTDVHNLVGKWWHKSGDVYVKKYCLSHGTYAYTIGFHPYTRIENIHNVHELQHALRLCGLEELADNFKV